MGMGFHGANRDAEGLGRLGFGALRVVAQDEDLPLTLGKRLHGREQRALLLGDEQRLIGRRCVRELTRVLPRHIQAGGLEPAQPRPAAVHDAGAQIRQRGLRIAKAPPMAVKLDERDLDEVFGRRVVVGEQDREPHEPAVVRSVKLDERIVGIGHARLPPLGETIGDGVHAAKTYDGPNG